MMLAHGDVMTTVSGHETTPFPHFDMGTERKMQNSLRRIDAWLHENAKAEIAARGLIDTLPADSRQMSQADRDICEIVLFDPTTL